MASAQQNTPEVERFEKLGVFYLGKLENSDATPELLLYDSKDLTTHAVCVGMTGSGKTGLCISLLEEAALDGVPAIAIDLKGDIANLLLTFPELKPADFEPWIDPAEAARKGATVKEHAGRTAKLWREGLASWGEDGARIRRLRDAADFTIFTPGSNAGVPLCLLKSFEAPPPELLDDNEMFSDRVNAAVNGLLGLLGLDADPLRSREHILLARILDHHWRGGQSLEIGQLIREIQSPPFSQIGVMDLETVYPEKDRFSLSMALNNLLAAPAMAGWMTGEPLEISRLLWTPEGKPRLSILSIAHLSEEERMFFVSMLLSEIVAWMRSQSGTASLRALLYMDEVFGYLPPSANPPSKKPMLTLLKQARAYGLGVVLATQNPVDLDYKALSNTGTWFIGRLQTERDKMRVLDGLEGTSLGQGAGFDRKRLDATLSGLSSRVFMMNNVHEDAPVLFRSRWAMSYLRGPLTRKQIKKLVGDGKTETAPSTEPKPAKPKKRKGKPPAAAATGAKRPLLSPKISEGFLAGNLPGPEAARLCYRPALLGRAELHYASATAGIDCWRRIACIAPLSEDLAKDPWGLSNSATGSTFKILEAPLPEAEFSGLPGAAADPKRYASWEKRFKTHLYRDRSLALARCPSLKLVARPGETAAQFRVRLREAAHELRDLEVAKLRKRYAPKLAQIRDRIARAEAHLQSEQTQYSKEKWDVAISIGTTLLGALFGRKISNSSSSSSSSLKGVGRAAKERTDVVKAEKEIAAEQKKLAALSAEFEREIEEKRGRLDPAALETDSLTIRPRKGDLAVDKISLLWLPWWVDSDGGEQPAFSFSDEG